MRPHHYARLAAVAALSLTLVGCATNSEGTFQWIADFRAKVKKVDTQELVVYEAPIPTDKPQRTNRELTLAWDNQGRAGAAVHQPDYVHVLSNDHDWQEISAPYGAARPGSGQRHQSRTLTLSVMDHSQAGKGFSVYEMRRWERYCDNGKGMDEDDWNFVALDDYAPPLDVLGTCVTPGYKYADYLDAWTRFCTGSPEYTSLDKDIVTNSVRPHSTVNPCKAMM